ncbi:MAG: phosphatidate cytidylyltransferase [Bacilli bacterium]|nr:phosphatidate cytidylyltransferase [Bacilli bacterium]
MKTRIISAILIAIVFIPFLYLGGVPFRVFFSILGVLALYEMIHIKDKKNRYPLIMKILSYLCVITLCLNNTMLFSSNHIISYQMIAIMMFMFMLPVIFFNDNDRYSIMDALYLVGAVMFIGLSFNMIILTRNQDINYLLYLLAITIVTDTFALFTGALIGKHKLCPAISPKKTIEGSVGGSLMGTFVGVAFYITVINSSINIIYIILVTLLLSIIGQCGDLVFSNIKRYFDQKDFGNLIPGHGGVLDRLDSFLFVVIAYVLLIDLI